MTSKDVEIFYNQAMKLFKKNEYKKSLELLNTILNMDSKFIPAWNIKGVIHIELKEFPQALNCFDQITYLNMKDYLAWYNKGYVLLLMERYIEAVKTFDFFLARYEKKDEFYKYALYLQAKCYCGLKEYEKSIECLKTVLKFDDNFIEAKELKSLVLKKLNRNKN